MKRLRTGDPSVARRDPHARFSGIGTEPGRPANRGLRPEGDVARSGYRRRHRDRLSHATVRRVEPQIERERSEEHTSELQSLAYLVCRLLLEKKKKKYAGCLSARIDRCVGRVVQ